MCGLPVPSYGQVIAADSIPEGFEDDKLIQYYFTEGLKSLKIERNYAAATEWFDQAIRLDPGHSPSYFEAANALMYSEPQRALEYSSEAVGLDTANAWYASQQARLFVMTGDYESAKRSYEKLVIMAPRNPENYGMLALLYQQTNQPYAAIAVLDKAENAMGKIEQLAQHKTELLVAAGLFDQAVEEARSLVAAYPYNYEGYLALAQLYAEGRKDSLALENYNMALALNPDGLDVIGSMNEYYRIKGDAENYLSTGRMLLQNPGLTLDVKTQFIRDITGNRNFYRENYFHIRELISLLYLQYPDDYGVVGLYANNMLAWGDFEDALQVHKDYIAKPREEMEPYMDVIGMEAYKQRNDSVRKYTEIALERFPTNPELYVRLGGTQSYMGNTRDALKSYETALKYSEGDSIRSVVLGVIGDEYHRAGDEKKSYRYYDKALELWDGNTMVLNNYSYYLSEQNKQLEKALRMAQRVMELEPSNPTYMDTYGWALFKLGRLEEAKTAIRQAIALDTRNSSELLIHYGDILHALGEEYMATVYWKRALEAGHEEEEINSRLESTAAGN